VGKSAVGQPHLLLLWAVAGRMLSSGLEMGVGAVEPSSAMIEQVGREYGCSRAPTRDKPARSPGNGPNYNPPDRQNALHERTYQQVQPLITRVLPQRTPIPGRHILEGQRSPCHPSRCGRNPLHHFSLDIHCWWQRI